MIDFSSSKRLEGREARGQEVQASGEVIVSQGLQGMNSCEEVWTVAGAASQRSQVPGQPGEKATTPVQSWVEVVASELKRGGEGQWCSSFAAGINAD